MCITILSVLSVLLAVAGLWYFFVGTAYLARKERRREGLYTGLSCLCFAGLCLVEQLGGGFVSVGVFLMLALAAIGCIFILLSRSAPE